MSQLTPGKAVLTSRLAGPAAPPADSLPEAETGAIEDPTSEGRALTYLAHGGSTRGGGPIPGAASALLERSYAADLSSARGSDRTAEAFAAGELTGV